MLRFYKIFIFNIDDNRFIKLFYEKKEIPCSFRSYLMNFSPSERLRFYNQALESLNEDHSGKQCSKWNEQNFIDLFLQENQGEGIFNLENFK